MRNDYQIILARLPGKVNETVTKNEDDSYTIFVEETLAPEYRKEAMLHALRHISEDDFNKKMYKKLSWIAILHKTLLYGTIVWNLFSRTKYKVYREVKYEYIYCFRS